MRDLPPSPSALGDVLRRRPLRAVPGVLTAVFLLVAATGSAADPPTSAQLANAANALLQALDSGQRAQIQFPFESDERLDWRFDTRAYTRGVALRGMTPKQVTLAGEVLQLALGITGVVTTGQIARLEDALERPGQTPGGSDYYVTLFGTPGKHGSWAASFVGSDLALNFTVIDGNVIASTPWFAEPNESEAPQPGKVGPIPAELERDPARTLLESLDHSQLSQAVVANAAPMNIGEGGAPTIASQKPQGIRISALGTEQRVMLYDLIDSYISAEDAENRQAREKQVEAAGDEIYFAWLGSIQAGAPHFYRIQGPSFVIEYDNVQGGASRSHVVWSSTGGETGDEKAGEPQEKQSP
jgi:Protein of unknown function (DUF3500)